ncbi:MAG: GNAT family N-acetyltransferase [Planctomycetota bacterium]
MIRYVTVEREHIASVMSLCGTEGYESYSTDADLTWRALSAPGVTSLAAMDGETVLGFVQMLSDGLVQAHLSMVLVDRSHRRRGIGRALVEKAFARAGGKRVDLLTDGAESFYRSFKNQDHWTGFRIYPGMDGP